MVSTRNKGVRKKVTPGAKTQVETKYPIALHVKTQAKRNPNADVMPVENPFLMDDEFLLRTDVNDIVSVISDVAYHNDIFKQRYEGYKYIDGIIGMKIWQGKRKSSSSSLKTQLCNCASINLDANTDDAHLVWKEYVKTQSQAVVQLGIEHKFVDVGIVLMKEDNRPKATESLLSTEIPSSITTSASASKLTSQHKKSLTQK